MSDSPTSLRLSKAAKEFNLSLGKIVEFLASKGFKVESNPNAKIGDEEYKFLQKEFAGDKVAKQEAATVTQVKLQLSKKETIVLEDIKVKKTNEVEEEVIIKDLTIPKSTNLPETTALENIEPSPDKTEKTKATNEPKVLGKVNLDLMNLKTKPDKKSKLDKKEKTENVTETKKGKEKTEELKPLTPQVADSLVEIQPEKIEPEFIETKYEKLEGPKILKKIELPVEKEPQKGTTNTNPHKKDREKRKRIQKGGLSQEEIKKVGSEQKEKHNKIQVSKYGDQSKGKKRQEPTRERHELTEEEIQAKIKETLSQLSKKGNKSQTSKNRRDKRSEVREKMAEKAELAEFEKKTLTVAEFVSANQLSKMMDVPVNQVISTCMQLGLFVSINQRLDAETINIVAEEFGYTINFASAEEIETVKEDEKDNPNDLVERPPIVTVMGHVDHGKTSLLDFVRKTTVVAGEAGGITQHIGAYNVTLANGRSITFLDTPGHEAFTAMRARGAKLTDIAIIVVAADDSVMPQTKEAINHAQAAGVPMIFAINKIDKPGANPNKIKEDLSQMNILVEEWGGKYQCQELSAKQGLNIDLLLEKVLLEADMMNLKANPNKHAQGTVIEASLEEGRGYVSTILVQTGNLKVGDIILAGSHSGRVRAMFNERGQKIEKAGPSIPVKVLGLSGAPTAGDKFNVMSDEREAREIASKRLQLQREQGIRTHKHITLDEIGRRLAIGDFKELNIIVKGDVDGSIEAIADSLLKLSTEKIVVNIIHKSVGAISENDVLLASASNAIIIGFQVRPTTNARKLAETEEIDIRLYSIIYDAINEIKAAMEGMLAPEYVEKIACNIEIREVFNISKVGTIAGCYVMDGKVTRNTKVRIIRDGIVIHSGALGSLKRFKDDVKEVNAGYECGLNIDGFNDIKVGDVVEGYEMIEVKVKL
ncbi:MAG: translation initiation factor IF-2 [Bacteroidetes bacterium]|nr:translation initiation factor IF-2 [Bacteroidota bacterium]